MRISDWSSDVCSSDLTPDEAERAFDTLVHDNVVDVVAEIPRHGRGKGVDACREERQKQDRYADIGGRKYGSDRKSARLTPVTNAHLVCRLLLEKKKETTITKQKKKQPT